MIFITYNQETGEITGRLIVTDTAAMVLYPNTLSVPREDYNSAPETWAEVDLGTKKLRAKPGHADPRKKNP